MKFCATRKFTDLSNFSRNEIDYALRNTIQLASTMTFFSLVKVTFKWGTKVYRSIFKEE